MARARRDPADRLPFWQRPNSTLIAAGILTLALAAGIAINKASSRHLEHVMDDQATALLRGLGDGSLTLGRGEAPYGLFTTRPRGYIASGSLETPGPEEITQVIKDAAEAIDIDVRCTTLYGATAGQFRTDHLGMQYTSNAGPTVVCNFFYRHYPAGKIALSATDSGSSILRFTYGLDYRGGYDLPGIRFSNYLADTT